MRRYRGQVVTRLDRGEQATRNATTLAAAHARQLAHRLLAVRLHSHNLESATDSPFHAGASVRHGSSATNALRQANPDGAEPKDEQAGTDEQ